MGGNMQTTFVTLTLLFTCTTAQAAQSSGYVRQIGGNKEQNTQIEYDRGGKHYSEYVKGGQTRAVPKDAQNYRVNGIPASPSSKITVSPLGVTQINE